MFAKCFPRVCICCSRFSLPSFSYFTATYFVLQALVNRKVKYSVGGEVPVSSVADKEPVNKEPSSKKDTAVPNSSPQPEVVKPIPQADKNERY